MSSFLTPLKLEYLDGRIWRLVEPFAYHVGHLGSGRIIEVPEGFETDFASIPRFLWWLYPPTGPWGKAAVIHDWLYETKPVSREEADTIFLEAMEVLGVPWHRRQIMYRAVRMFGGWIWQSQNPK